MREKPELHVSQLQGGHLAAPGGEHAEHAIDAKLYSVEVPAVSDIDTPDIEAKVACPQLGIIFIITILKRVVILRVCSLRQFMFCSSFCKIIPPTNGFYDGLMW